MVDSKHESVARDDTCQYLLYPPLVLCTLLTYVPQDARKSQQL
jgi:hypothetical protein